MILRPPRSTRTDTLFPYTTLFRSAGGNSRGPHGAAVVRARCLPSSPPPPQAPFGAKHDERAARAEQGEREPGDRIDQMRVAEMHDRQPADGHRPGIDRKSTRLNPSH